MAAETLNYSSKIYPIDLFHVIYADDMHVVVRYAFRGWDNEPQTARLRLPTAQQGRFDFNNPAHLPRLLSLFYTWVKVVGGNGMVSAGGIRSQGAAGYNTIGDHAANTTSI